jgi:hypothetical protein
MKNAFTISVSMALMVTAASSSAFASKLCGAISHEGNDPGTGTAIFSVTEKNGTYWEVDPANDSIELSLLSLSERTIQAHSVRVCVEGQVILHDEDKGNVFSATSAQQEE